MTTITMPLEEQFGEAPSQVIPMYNGAVKLLYNDATHIYSLDTPEGRIHCPGVTTICKMLDKSNVLIPWAVKQMEEHIRTAIALDAMDDTTVMHFDKPFLENLLKEAKGAHRAKKSRAGDVGKIAHSWLENYAKLRLSGLSHEHAASRNALPTDEKAKHCVLDALSWHAIHHVQFISAERKVYSREYHYAGTMDFNALVDGSLSILDYKTGKYIYDEYRYQTAAYQAADEEEDPSKHYDQRVLIKLGKEDGEFDVQVIAGDDEYQADLATFRALLMVYDRTSELSARAKEIREEKKSRRKKAA
jgi:hypothetical protein